MAKWVMIAGAALLATACAAGPLRQQGPMRAAEVATNPPRAITPACGSPGIGPPHEICRRD